MASRKELDSSLKGETLIRKGLMERINSIPQVKIIPDLNVVKIGGYGIIDYGRKIVLPLVKEIGHLSRNNKLLIVTGGGVRVRHILDLGLDLGIPTGVLAELAGKISEQNAIMLSVLLSKYNGVRIHTSDLLEVPTYVNLGLLPIIHGTPPYGFYEHPPLQGSIPPHRTDTGAFLVAEVLGAKNCILVKNVDGLYSEDPRINPQTEIISEITAQELLKMDMEDMVLERMTVELLRSAKNVKEVKIVNGHIRGNITKAIMGEKIGTIIKR
ncbi:amino acid kinase family protein [[Eubacterium] cellulosolvens]